MEGGDGIWRFLVIALVAVLAGAGVGVLLGGANSDPFETVVKTVSGKRQTVTVTETETVTETKQKTVTETEDVKPAGGGAGDDDVDHDGCSDSYEPECLPPSDGSTAVSCAELGDEDFSSIGSDPYSLDPDRDGVACESR